MLTFKQILTFAYDSEYESAYDLSEKRLFSEPKIYTGNNDLKKRWYVYFSFRDPETGRLKRQTPIYGNAQGYKTKEERLAVLTVLQKTLLRLLRRGFNPYGDNTELFNSLYNGTSEAPKALGSKGDDGTGQPKEPNPIERQLPKQAEREGESGPTLDEAFKLDAEIKSETLQASSQRSYNSHINVFRKWLAENRPKMEYIGQLDKQTVLDFLKHILKNSSARNRNNYRASLSSLFSTLEEHEYVSSNFVKRIKVYKSSPKRNKSYTDNQQQEIFDHLEKEDPLLLLFIKFVSYNFLRPIEVCRLKVGDIDLEKRTLSFKAKNSEHKTKIIPEILWRDLPSLTAFKREHFLFTPQVLGGQWEGTADSKRNYFSKRFKKVVKEKFSLGDDHGMYSFRHTFISKLYKELEKVSSPHAAKSKLMQITGHSSMKALEQYLRSIDAELPEDYSEMIKN